MEDASESTQFRILMFPWLAHGHISPFLQLSKKLTQNNFKIHFCSTAINLNFIKENLGPETSSDNSIRLIELHLLESPELPPEYHTTKNLPPNLMSTLMKSFQIAKSSFSNIVKNLSPDLIIYDSFQSWVSDIAAIFGIPSVHFATSGAATMSFFYRQLSSRRNFGGSPFPEIFQKDYEREKFQSLVDSDKWVAEDFAFRSFDLSPEIVLIRSSIEVEEKYLHYLSFLCGKKILTTGPLIQEDSNSHSDVSIIEFLDKKDQFSVIFVSFGSEYFLSSEEREEIAFGLELSNVNFIWVVRFPVGNTISIEEAMPEGFLERVKERGIVVDGWAPQAKILQHSSTGGFLSHCGWSSVMESLYFGVPVIAVPMHLDQPTNARVLVEIGVGMEVLRGENGKIRREEVAKVVKLVVLGENGEEMRGKVEDLSKKLRIRGVGEIDEALEEIRILCGRNTQQPG